AASRAAQVSSRAAQASSPTEPSAFSPAHMAMSAEPTATRAEQAAVHSVPAAFPHERPASRAEHPSGRARQASISPAQASVQAVDVSPTKGIGSSMSDSARELREPGPGLEREFEAIYRREFPLALRFARRYVNDDDAEDVVQSVFMGYWEGYTQRPALVFGAD